MKKIVCLCLMLLLLCGLVTACGESNTASHKDNKDEEVTLVIAVPSSKQADADKVIAEINKKLETLLPNTKVEFLLDSNMSDKWSLWMSMKKKIDIAHSGWAMDIEDEVRKESFLELDELVEEYAPTIQKMRDTYWNEFNNATIQKNLYAIPNVQYHTKEVLRLSLWEQMTPHMDMKALKEEAWSSDKTTEKFYQILTAGLDKAAAAGVDISGSINLSLYELPKRGYHFIGGADSNLCYDNSDSGKIIDFYTTDEFTIFCKYMKDWAGKGYVSNDVLTGQWSDKTYVSTGSRYGVNAETGISEIYTQEGQVYLVLDNPDNDVLVTDIGSQGTYWSIPFTSEHPARAMKFLDLLNSEEGAEIVNLLAFGIEGKHYEFVDKEKGDIKAFEYEGQGHESVSYGIPCWVVSNMMQGMYCVAPYTHEYKEYADEYYANMDNIKKHVLYGYSFDVEGVRNQFSQLVKNNAEYAESIYSGVVGNSDTLLTELLEKNKTAGQEEIMKELQKQADEYMASSK